MEKEPDTKAPVEDVKKMDDTAYIITKEEFIKDMFFRLHSIPIKNKIVFIYNKEAKFGFKTEMMPYDMTPNAYAKICEVGYILSKLKLSVAEFETLFKAYNLKVEIIR